MIKNRDLPEQATVRRERIRKKADSLLGKLIDHARFVRATRGKGRLGKVDSLLGRGQGYCARFLGEEFVGVDLGEFLGMLVALEVDVPKFFVEALTFHPERYLWKLEGRAPNEVRYCKRQLRWARKDRSPSDVDRARELVPGLEERRMLDRAKVKQECIQALGALSQEKESAELLELRCEAIGVLGAICRTQGSLSSAAFCEREALGLTARLAEENLEAGARARARTLRRVAYLVGDLGESEEAIKLVASARELYEKNADQHGVGETLVDSGTFLSMLGRFAEAVKDFEASLNHLPQLAWRYRFSALQGLGICHVELKQSKEALGFLEKALREVRGRGSEPMAQWILWLRGRIRFESQDWLQAEDDFRAVRAIHLEGAGSPLDVALISLELAKTLLLQGKLESLRQLTQEMMPLIGRLESNPLMVATIEQYLLAALRGRVSMETIEETLRKLRDIPESETSLLGSKSLAG